MKKFISALMAAFLLAFMASCSSAPAVTGNTMIKASAPTANSDQTRDSAPTGMIDPSTVTIAITVDGVTISGDAPTVPVVLEGPITVTLNSGTEVDLGSVDLDGTYNTVTVGAPISIHLTDASGQLDVTVPIATPVTVSLPSPITVQPGDNGEIALQFDLVQWMAYAAAALGNPQTLADSIAAGIASGDLSALAGLL